MGDGGMKEEMRDGRGRKLGRVEMERWERNDGKERLGLVGMKAGRGMATTGEGQKGGGVEEGWGGGGEDDEWTTD